MNFIHKNIKFLREQRQLSHKQLGVMCNLSADAIKSLENGISEPKLDELVLFSEALNYPVDRLILENLEKTYYQLKSFDFKFLALDIDGSIWIATDEGLSHFTGEKWLNYSN